MPTVNIGNISNGTTLVEDSYKLNEEGNAAEATIKMVSGKMLLQFSGAAGTTKNYFYSYYNPTSNSDIIGSKTTTSATLTSLVFDDNAADQGQRQYTGLRFLSSTICCQRTIHPLQ